MPTTDLSTEALLVRRRRLPRRRRRGRGSLTSFEVSRHIKAITGDGPTDYALLAWICPKHPANIRAELLEKEAEWLANRLACIQSARDIEPQTRYRSSEWWRETARKAVEEV